MNTKARNLFTRALERPESERDAFLFRDCAGDAEVRLELRSMLVDAARADSFFGDGAGATPSAGEYRDSHAEQEGDVIGTYKLHQQIGEGGFGMVWIKDVIATLLGRITIDKTVCHGKPTTRGLCFPVVVFPEYPAAWLAGGVSIRRPRGDSQTGPTHESAVHEIRKFFAT